MDSIIPSLLILFGLLGLVLLFNKNSPKISWNLQTIKHRIKDKRRSFHWSLYQIKIKNIGLNFLEKFLIRLRILLLRLERVVHNNLSKIKNIKNNENKKEPNFFVFALKESRKTAEQTYFAFTQTLITDFISEERKLIKKLNKNPQDLDSIRNLAHLYLYQEDLPSACWIIVKGILLNPQDKVLQGLVCELNEKDREEKNKNLEQKIE